MKKIVMMLVALLTMSQSACSQKKESKEMTKVLVAYFSATGTTKGVAKQLAEVTGGTLHEIKPAQPYTDADLNWRDKQSRSSVEMKDKTSRPAITDKFKNMKDYDVIYVGFPIWWYTCPTIINTFMEAYDFKGKTVIPFATSGGSDIKKACEDLKAAYPDVNWKEGKLLNRATKKDIETWVKTLTNDLSNMSTIYDYKALSNKGKEVNFADYKGKVLLVVNTASKCGFTPQYDGLEAPYQKYKDQGLVIIGFPCDQFGHQEPGTNEEIEEFCRLNHGVTFPLMSKIEVNGENAHPVYKWLESQAGFAGFAPEHKLSKLMDEMLSKADPDYASKPDIKWNFTKFLINREGKVVGRFEPTSEPSDLEKPIEEQL